MSNLGFIDTGDRRYLWRDIFERRRAQKSAHVATQQLALFEVKRDCRPALVRTPGGPVLEPSLFEEYTGVTKPDDDHRRERLKGYWGEADPGGERFAETRTITCSWNAPGQLRLFISLPESQTLPGIVEGYRLFTARKMLDMVQPGRQRSPPHKLLAHAVRHSFWSEVTVLGSLPAEPGPRSHAAHGASPSASYGSVSALRVSITDAHMRRGRAGFPICGAAAPVAKGCALARSKPLPPKTQFSCASRRRKKTAFQIPEKGLSACYPPFATWQGCSSSCTPETTNGGDHE